MTKRSGRPLLDASAIEGVAWNRRTFDKLVNLIGARAANDLATRFRSDLRDRFADARNRERLRFDAHAVTSTSELLGFATLSQAARRLDKAFETGDAIDASLLTLMIAKADAIRALDEFITLAQTAT